MDAKVTAGFSIDPTYIESLFRLCRDVMERCQRAQKNARDTSKRWNEVKNRSDQLVKELSNPKF